MKVLLSILLILTVLTAYSTGAFVPEHDGIVDTVAGLAVLSDADLAQQAGGIWRGTRKKAEIVTWPVGQPSSCYSSNGCNSGGCNSGGCNSGGCNSGGCNSGGCAPDCPPDKQVFTVFRHKCVKCYGYDQWTTSRKLDHDATKEITSECKMINGVCVYTEVVTGTWSSCVTYVTPRCA
jgi:hypothetical protein